MLWDAALGVEIFKLVLHRGVRWPGAEECLTKQAGEMEAKQVCQPPVVKLSYNDDLQCAVWILVAGYAQLCVWGGGGGGRAAEPKIQKTHQTPQNQKA